VALSLNADAESAGSSDVAPESAPYAAQANAASPAIGKIMRARFMIVVLLAVRASRQPLAARRPSLNRERRQNRATVCPYCNRLPGDLQTRLAFR